MTFHPERYIGLGFLVLMFAVVAPPAADWLGTNYQLPPGYGAAGDRRRTDHIPPTAADRWRTGHIPAPVRTTVEERSAGSEASWVKECVEDGAWVYELHLLKDHKWSVIRITPNGYVIQPGSEEPEPGGVVEVGG